MSEPGRVAVFDLFSGIAGDMTLAALIDAGAPLETVVAGLNTLGLPPFTLATEPVQRAGMAALALHVTVSEDRTFQPPEMRAMLAAAAIPARARERALAAVEALAEGEALAHRTAEPHFHEAGGVDALIDLTGTMLALEALDIDSATCAVVTVGSGTITRSAHGALPAAPGPAAARILERAGFPLRFVEAGHELVTPSGAAILAAVAKPGPAVITPERHGAGAGTMDPPGRPNALRVFIGRAAPRADDLALREVVELVANIDDMPPSLLAHARDRLIEAGALDAWTEPIGMKKGRAAIKLAVLTTPEREREFASLIVRETSTLGVRATAYRRYEAPRAIETFASSLGPVAMKVRTLPGARSAIPEFEDVKRIASEHFLPARDVQRLIEAEWSAWLRRDSPGPG